MNILKKIGVGILVTETLRITPMLLTFGVTLSILNLLPTKKPEHISYSSSGFIELYLADEAVVYHCGNIEIAVKQNKNESKASLKSENCEFYQVMANNSTQSYTPWSQNIDHAKLLESYQIYPYLNEHGKEFLNVTSSIGISYGSHTYEQNCIIPNWTKVTYQDSNSELNIEVFCPRLMNMHGFPISLNIQPIYYNTNSEVSPPRLQTWPNNISQVYSDFEKTIKDIQKENE